MQVVENFNGYGVPEKKEDWFIVGIMVALIYVIYKINSQIKN